MRILDTHAPGTWTFLFVGVLIVGLGTGAKMGAAEPILTEKILPPDAIVAVFLRDVSATAERWKGTALYELLQTSEMKEMIAPLAESIKKLSALGDELPTTPASLTTLLKGEAGAAVVLRKTEDGAITAATQLVLRPADAVKAKEIIDKWLAYAVEKQLARRTATIGGTTFLKIKQSAVLAYTFADGMVLFTFYPAEYKDGSTVHNEALARRTRPGGGLAADAEYALVREKLGAEPEAWLYVGAFSWLAQHPTELPMAMPVLTSLGVSNVRGLALGSTIEDRGFRTRMFTHIQQMPNEPRKGAITQQELALVPRDVLAFKIGSVDWRGLYDKVTMLSSMLPPPAGPAIAQGIIKIETALGMSIRDDLLAVLGDRVIHYATEQGSDIGYANSLFVKVREKNEAVEKLTKALDAVANMIRTAVGEGGDAFVRMRTIERPQFTQIYPQSILPALISPSFLVSDGWLGVSLSARTALANMDYFLNHTETVASRQDFGRVLAKMPSAHYSVSYTDVGRCFGNGLGTIQFATDVLIPIIKGSAHEGEFKLPMPIKELWGMDPGRFPSEALLREKLFGSVSVWVQQEDGILYENFSPIGPIPLPTRPVRYLDFHAATIPVMAGMLLPALARAREEGRAAACMNNLSLITKALVTYQEPNDDNLPPSLADLVPAYLDNPRVLICPSDGDPMRIRNGLPCSYRYIGNVPVREAWPGLIVLYDHTPHARGRGRNAGHYDGHLRRYSEGEFKVKLAEQYEQMKKIMAKPGFPGDPGRVKAFYEDRDFSEE